MCVQRAHFIWLCVCGFYLCVCSTVVTHWQLGSDLHLSLSSFLPLSASFFPVSAAQSSLHCTEWPLFSVHWRHPCGEKERERVQSDAHKLSFNCSLSRNVRAILPKIDLSETVWEGEKVAVFCLWLGVQSHVHRNCIVKVPVGGCLWIHCINTGFSEMACLCLRLTAEEFWLVLRHTTL